MVHRQFDQQHTLQQRLLSFSCWMKRIDPRNDTIHVGQNRSLTHLNNPFQSLDKHEYDIYSHE